MTKTSSDSETLLEEANKLFFNGSFEKAEKIYKQIISLEKDNIEALRKLGMIALYSNKFTEAEKYLPTVLEKCETGKIPYSQSIMKNTELLLAETYYRKDKFSLASFLYRKVGLETEADKLEKISENSPYEITIDGEVAIVKFEMTDPLPVVKVSVNDSEPLNFVIDTGADEVIINFEAAVKLRLGIFGETEGTFAGGQKAPVIQGFIDSLKIGNLQVSNLPVRIVKLNHISPIFGIPISGVIGTVLFYHFITTIDYPNGQLVLHKKTKENLEKIENQLKPKSSVFPFWMAGKHIVVAWGKINKGRPMLFFVDTGLAGGGFTASKEVLEEAGVAIDFGKASKGIGGAGQVTAVPILINELALGNKSVKNVRGTYIENAPLRGSLFGFKIEGLISHTFFRTFAVTFDFEKMRMFLE